MKKTIWAVRQKLFGYESARSVDIFPYIKNRIPESGSLLDVGCGQPYDGHDYLSLFKNYKIKGIDIHPPCIRWRKQNMKYGEYSVQDAMKLDDTHYDVVMANHIIEHLPKDDSVKLVNKLESITDKLLIIGAPIGFVNTDYNVDLHDNEHERHHCGWTPREFYDKGYEVIIYKNVFVAFLRKK